MARLTFSALLAEEGDTKITGASLTSSVSSAAETPLSFEFDFGLDEHDADRFDEHGEGLDDIQIRSPRTPTYQGEAYSSGSLSPFNADKFFKFPLLSSSQERSPLTALSSSPAGKSHSHIHLARSTSLNLPAPPLKSPLLWIWTCHLCHSRYPLGATRRCLIDGHFYCSGELAKNNSQRGGKRKKRGQSCSSEFDYAGWRDWGSWKRDVTKAKRQSLAGSTPRKRSFKLDLKGCEACEYPSQCRHEKMERVLEVVAASAKKTDHHEQSKRSSSTTSKARTTTAKKAVDLKVDTGSSSNLKSKFKETIGICAKPKSGSTSESTDPPENTSNQNPCRVNAAQSQNSISSPESPDLVDFSSMADHTADGVGSNTTQEEKPASAPSSTHALSNQSSSSRTKTRESMQTNHTVDDTIASMDLPKLTRTKSRTEPREGERSILKQSRISDFFGMTR